MNNTNKGFITLACQELLQNSKGKEKWIRDMNKKFTEKKIQIVKKINISLMIKEMEIRKYNTKENAKHVKHLRTPSGDNVEKVSILICCW